MAYDDDHEGYVLPREDAKVHERHAWLKLLRAVAFCRKCEEPCFDSDPRRVNEFFQLHMPHVTQEAP